MAKTLYDVRVKDVMSRHVITINAQDLVHEAMELMIENKVHALPVVDNHDRCVGILSTSDFVDVTYDLDSGLDTIDHSSEVWWGAFIKNISNHVGHQSVTDLMTEDVVSVTPDTLLFAAASAMLRDHIHRLPVVDGKSKLLGIVSTTDMLKAFVDNAPQ